MKRRVSRCLPTGALPSVPEWRTSEKSTSAKRGMDMRLEVDIGTRMESAIYAM